MTVLSSSLKHKLAKVIIQAQQRDGGFLMQVESRLLQGNFFNALILAAISQCEISELENTKNKLAKFIALQVKPSGAINYWVNNSQISKERLYPDDLDDTFCSYVALNLYDKTLIDGKVLANAVKMLTALEVAEGGPYRTWLVPANSKSEWLDVDVAVNSNIMYFLKLQNITLPNLDRYIAKSISSKKLRSPYYFGQDPVIYFLSRGYSGNTTAIIKRLLQKRYKAMELQNIALLLSSLINLGYRGAKIDQIAAYLALQASKMPIPASPFHIDQVLNGKPQYAGSEALTAAFILEALCKHEAVKQPFAEFTSEPVHLAEVGQFVFDTLDAMANRFPKPLKERLNKEHLSITEGRYKDEIMFLPYFIYTMLDPKLKQWKKYKEKVTQACALGVLGWTAYKIFDDFMDSEAEPLRLPLAIIYFREMLTAAQKLEAEEFSQNIMDDIEKANFWELAECSISLSNRVNLKDVSLPKFGAYENLGNKSIGHALGSLAVYDSWLKDQKISKNNRIKAVASLKEFFLQYIIARQISDDLHDWKQDLNAGRINCVSAWMLDVLKEKYKRSLSKDKLFEELQALYWDQTLSVFAKQMLKSLKRAQETSGQLIHFENTEQLLDLLIPYERLARRSIDDSKRAKEFLRTYTK